MINYALIRFLPKMILRKNQSAISTFLYNIISRIKSKAVLRGIFEKKKIYVELYGGYVKKTKRIDL